jgi:hypothetical protein
MTLNDYLGKNKGVAWSQHWAKTVIHRTYEELTVSGSASTVVMTDELANASLFGSLTGPRRR